MQKRPILEIKTDNHHLFLQEGFFNMNSPTTLTHFHGYTEIHIVICGEMKYIIDGNAYTFKAGDILAIPPKTYHYCAEKNDAQSIAFQIEKKLDSLKSTNLSLTLVVDFVNEIKKAAQSNNYSNIIKYISLFCGLFIDEKTVRPIESVDYSLLISEFFSNRYNQNVTILSLSNELNLSEKQTARLVKKYTGNTFNEELTLRRINVANYLIKSTDMTMGEIAEYVGFKSYSGFWKAYKKKTDKP